jgi:hypothetical protein
MTRERENKEVPLRVRVTAVEDERLMAAATKLGLTKSVYVRWAIENSTTQVLGTASGPVVRTAEPVKQKRVRLATIQPPAPPPPVEEPVPSVASLFDAYNNSVANMTAVVEEIGGPQEATFDDEGWS